MIKYSRQREAIFDFLSTRTDHPSADTIYQNLRSTHPNLSLGTVYRNLGLLESTGKIARLTIEGGSDRYDPNPQPHYHFYCRCCQSVSDIPMSALDSLNQLAQAHISGIIEGHSLTFHGLCEDCRLKQTKQLKLSESKAQ